MPAAIRISSAASMRVPWADFQEFYIQNMAPVGRGLNLQSGQINSLVGYEVVKSPHNANYSRSWLLGLGQPFTTRGVRASYEFNKQVALPLGAVAYINSARADTNHDPLVEYALANYVLRDREAHAV
jgi:hypothetical protein